MSTQVTGIRNCPQCKTDVDPLRAKAVSIVDGKITHFCSIDCREAYLKRDEDKDGKPVSEEYLSSEVPLENVATPEVSVPNEISEQINNHDAVRKNQRRMDVLGRLVLPYGISGAVQIILAVCVIVVPQHLLGGWILALLAGVGATMALALGILRDFRNGMARLLERVTIPVVSFLLVLHSGIGEPSRISPFVAVALLAVNDLGRIAEFALRFRSGITDIIAGYPPALLASEWRDNSSVAANIRRFTLFMEWGRIPTSVLIGGGVWFFGLGGIAEGILAVAISLVGLNPRAIRMATGDAHLSVALRAAHRGSVIRDAHAVDRVGRSRVALLMSKQALIKSSLRLIDWRTVEGGVDEEHVLAALCAVESTLTDRFASAIRRYLKERSAVQIEEVQPEEVSGKGVMGNTIYGRIICGSRVLLLEQGISTGQYEPWAKGIESSGRRAFFVALDGQMVAMFGIEEEPVDDVVDATQRLSMIGLTPAMITSAEVNAAQALGARMGIDYIKFGKRDEELESVLSEIASSGDKVLLIGHGKAFEECLREATAAISIGTDKGSLAGVDSGTGRLKDVVQLISDALNAKRSVRINLFISVLAILFSVCLAWGWHSPNVVLFAGGITVGASVMATLNGPYPLWEALLKIVNRLGRQVARVLGLRRN